MKLFNTAPRVTIVQLIWSISQITHTHTPYQIRTRFQQSLVSILSCDAIPGITGPKSVKDMIIKLGDNNILQSCSSSDIKLFCLVWIPYARVCTYWWNDRWIKHIFPSLGWLTCAMHPINHNSTLSSDAGISSDLAPAITVHLWKSNFKQQLGCRFDIMDNESYFCCVLTYMSWYIRSFFGFTFLNILYFFKYSCTNVFHGRSLYTFY